MAYLRERLASYLYRSAIDTNPAPVVVARLSHPDGLVWRLEGGVFRFRIGAGAVQFVSMIGTVNDLINDVAPFGIGASFIVDELSEVPSTALIEGRGSSASSETDALTVFSSTLWTLLDAYGAELDEADANLVAALEQLYMNTADGEFLDVWGGYFGVPRKPSEADTVYYARIVREVLRPRVNRFAIEAAIFDDTGLLVSLREPHREIFRLSISGLSSGHHLQDGRFYTWNVFQPVYHSNMSLAERDRVLAIIERNRPAGCLIVGEDVQPPIGYVEGAFGQSVSGRLVLTNYLGVMPFATGQLSATLFLSNMRELVNSQFYWRQFGEVTYTFGTEANSNIFDQRGWTGPWDSEVWNRPSVSAVVTQHPA